MHHVQIVLFSGLGAEAIADRARQLLRSEMGRLRIDGLESLHRIAKDHGGECLEILYSGLEKQHRFKCANGHEWRTSAATILRGSWCRRCANQLMSELRRSVAGLQKLQAAAVSKGGICLSAAYTIAADQYHFRCAEGHEWSAAGKNILRNGWCPTCARRSLHLHNLRQDGILRLQQIASRHGGLCLDEEYKGTTSHYSFRCIEGHEWQSQGAKVVAGSWCPNCASNPPGEQRRRIKLMHTIAHERGGRCLSDQYINVKTKLKWECARGHIWFGLPSNIVRGHWCPECAHYSRIRNRKSKAGLKYEKCKNTQHTTD